MPLINFKSETLSKSKNIFSQNGEDGIIQFILEKIGDKLSNFNICEFGAWDGKHLSNTFNLINSDNKFIGLFIEGDPEKYNDLLKTCETHKNIIPHLAYVDHNIGSNNSIDNILKFHNFPNDMFLISIDIDSYDYQVFSSMEEYKPIVVIVEINSSISPLNTEYIHDGKNCIGTSFMPMYILGVKKGYKLLVHTGNLIFIRNDFACYFGIENNDVETSLGLFNPSWFSTNNNSEFIKLYR